MLSNWRNPPRPVEKSAEQGSRITGDTGKSADGERDSAGSVVAKEFGLSRETVRKMLQYAVPPGYQRQQPINRPKLGPWLGVIDAIVEDDKQRPVKQRHTAKRIFERLKEEHGFTGCYTIVKDYARSAELHGREMFIP